ncbi:MAG: N-acetylmuramoyl-L-alanine amidase family protein, partial [Lachnospiraceae bacterium]|nr:N-acetylmuramoyl-L-alanine amidase family protein [Lachnospiraceae bacterium]
GGIGVSQGLTDFSYTIYSSLEPGKTWKLKVYLAYDYYGDEEWREVDFQMLELTVPELDALVYVNSDWGKEEGNIIKSVTYESNGDGTYKAYVSVDFSCVDEQKLADNYGGVGYCWYDHNNKIRYGGIGVSQGLTDFSYTIYSNLESGKTWKLKVYLAYDYYGDEEWREVDFQMLELTVPTLDVYEGWINIDGKWYYYHNGTMQTGWVSVGGKWYYMNSSGVMQTGWVKIGSRYYYMNSSGVMQTGWVKIGSRYYYMNSSGVMVTGWVYVGNKYYYMNSSGTMVTGWVYVGGKYYYMNSSGAMVTGWVYVGGKYYYMNSSGVMQTGWVKVGSNWYYMNSSGVMQTGWVKVGSNWYYMNSLGAMQTGWVKIGSNWYYMNSSGVMQTGTQVIDGKTYNFNASGVWIR